jgi:hypothetical protein
LKNLTSTFDLVFGSGLASRKIKERIEFYINEHKVELTKMLKQDQEKAKSQSKKDTQNGG